MTKLYKTPSLFLFLITSIVLSASQKTAQQEFNRFIEDYQARFDRLKEIGKETHRLETALKHLGNHDRLLPNYEQSKRGFASTREKYAEAHKNKLDSFRKSVRYMRANGLTSEDESRLQNEKKILAAERDQINAELMREDIQPDLVRIIMDCIEAIQKADEEKEAASRTEHASQKPEARPEKKVSVREFIRQAQMEIKTRDSENSRKKPDVQIGER